MREGGSEWDHICRHVKDVEETPFPDFSLICQHDA